MNSGDLRLRVVDGNIVPYSRPPGRRILYARLSIVLIFPLPLHVQYLLRSTRAPHPSFRRAPATAHSPARASIAARPRRAQAPGVTQRAESKHSGQQRTAAHGFNCPPPPAAGCNTICSSSPVLTDLIEIAQRRVVFLAPASSDSLFRRRSMCSVPFFSSTFIVYTSNFASLFSGFGTLLTCQPERQFDRYVVHFLRHVMEIERMHPRSCAHTCAFPARRKFPQASTPALPAPDTQPGTFRSNSATSFGSAAGPIRLIRQIHFDGRRNHVPHLVFQQLLPSASRPRFAPPRARYRFQIRNMLPLTFLPDFLLASISGPPYAQSANRRFPACSSQSTFRRLCPASTPAYSSPPTAASRMA